MRGDGSAYAALGLEPDADRSEIDRAYRRLIKLHHPDREGGDESRAAEINRAYRELRGRPDPETALEFHENEPQPGAGRGWARAALVLVVGVAALLVGTGPVTALLSPQEQPLERSSVSAAAGDPMDQVIDAAEVSRGVRDALRISGRHSDAALLNASRDCHRQLRLEPSMKRLDRCAAFDDAVVQIQDRDPMWDRGPFSQLAVTGRQWSAASALSNDYLAVDGRLNRIRLQVELALAAPESRR
ncbi:MAG: J domain-containing protein [Sphingomicrobium sp.]